MTEPQPQITVSKGFWAELFTGPRLVMFGFGIFVLGQHYSGLRAEITSNRERLTQLEITIPRDYQRRETLEKDMQAIRDEQTRLRQATEKMTEIVEKLRKDMLR